MAWKDTFKDFRKNGMTIQEITSQLDILIWLGEINEAEKTEILQAVNEI